MNTNFDKTDPLFAKYIGHVLRWEGKTSKDQRDTAASCAPYKGAFHTNKGITYCTFKKLSKSLGISPPTYQRFLALSTEDVMSFAFAFCHAAEADELDTKLGLAVTEAAWMSGPYRARVHLQDALNAYRLLKGKSKLKVDGDIGPTTLQALKESDPEKLYKFYWIMRQQFLDYLTAIPKYAMYKKGWQNRITDFLKLFPITSV